MPPLEQQTAAFFREFFVKKHGWILPFTIKRDIFDHCDMKKLNSKELMKLYGEGIYGLEELLFISLERQDRMMQEIEELKRENEKQQRCKSSSHYKMK